ncbi:MAG: lectin like domain-containing protein [Peptococcaceae bacterium]|nr:lectin like domain-containing protein [Peptococcaceae bacterium]
MNRRWLKHILSAVIVAALAVTAPVHADTIDSKTESPLSSHIDRAEINPDYLDWLEDGEGLAPSAQDFSYLADSYAAEGTGDVSTASNRARALPSSYDLRDLGKVTPVSNQGALGICWSIAANDAAAGVLLPQNPSLRLSSSHTAWFCYTGDAEEEYFGKVDPYMAGGNDGRAVGTMAAWKGPITDDQAPLNLKSPASLAESLRYKADYHLQDAYYMPSGVYFGNNQDLTISQDITKQLLMDVGPVTLSYYSHNDGVYNPQTYAWYSATPARSDHAVLVVGWDDNYSRDNFLEGNRPAHDGAWLVRNSWGTNWGDDGYFWLSYEDATIVSGNAYLLEEADNYAHNYQYDTTGWSYSTSTNLDDPKTATAANIFTAESAEQLEAVSFYTTDANTRYEISVYTGVDAGKPTSGTCRLIGQSGSEPYAGYHTIELDKAVALAAGERFSIVITLENPTYEMPLAIEWCQLSGGKKAPTYMGSGGESYALVGGQWEDVAGKTTSGFYITNVCIKGFTNPLPEDGAAVATVRFSEKSGAIAAGTALSLSAEGADEIYYSTDGASYSRYTGPITIGDRARTTVRAYAVTGGQRGNTTSKTYTHATASLSDLAIRYGDTKSHITTDGLTSKAITLPKSAESVRVMAQSADEIRANGQRLSAADWSGEIPVAAAGTTTVTVTLSAAGKDTRTITLHLSRDGSTPTDPGDQTTYSVTLAHIGEGGSVSTDLANARAGAAVTLTTTPESGYKLENLRVTNHNGEAVALENLGDGRWRFTMPAEDVSVDATFRQQSVCPLPFTDVPEDAWYHDNVAYAYDNGLMVGMNETRFEPEVGVTRAMVWAVLARQVGADTQSAAGEPWYAGAQKWAVDNGVSDGQNPLAGVSRQELVTMFYRLHGAPQTNAASLDVFTDSAEIASWATDAMAWGVDTGFIGGLTPTTLAPKSGATRAQLATFLMRYIEDIA